MATKQTTRRKRGGQDANLKLLCSSLLAENEELQGELTKLREENRSLRRSLGAVVCKDFPVHKRLTLADAANEPPLAELIAELEAAGD
jgi:hypothetical protein